MNGYCIPCAAGVNVQPLLGMQDHAFEGTCAICGKPALLLTTTFFDHGRHCLDAAALQAKLRRGEALPRTDV